MNKRTKWWLVALTTVLCCLVTTALGFWQLSRAAQKNALGQTMAQRAVGTPVDVAALLAAPDSAQLLYRPTTLEGQWLADKTVFLDNRQMQNRVGFYVVTPLLLGNGQAALVYRGWAPRNFLDRAALPAVPAAPGQVRITGFIAPEPGKLYELGPAQMTVIRQNLPIAAFAAETRLKLLPVVLMQSGDSPDGLLRAWPAVQLGVEKHYGYAVQWFAIALLAAGLWVWFQLLKPRLRRTKESVPHAK